MVRKVINIVVICILLVGAFCTQANAETHSIYTEGNMNTTYITYFEDILSGTDLKSNYVAFRSGQYTYTMVVGDLDINNNVISLNGTGKEYIFTQSGNYNSQYTYQVKNISNFSLNTGNYIIYSDIGDYPQLIERGAKFEILQTLLIFIVCLCIVIRSIFNPYKR